MTSCDVADTVTLEQQASALQRQTKRFLTSSLSADVQKRATRVLNSTSDAVIQSATGSGKSLSFVMPLLGSALRYPPEANPAEFPVRPAHWHFPPAKCMNNEIVMGCCFASSLTACKQVSGIGL